MIKDIPGYEGLYAVDDSGNIYSYKWGKFKKLKPSVDGVGYYVINLCKDNFKKTFHVHRLVAKAFLADFREDLKVDHYDRNKLNNSLDNLRMLTHQENMFNTAAKGFSWHKKAKKFEAYININRKKINLGLFNTEAEARAAYLKAKEVYHRIES